MRSRTKKPKTRLELYRKVVWMWYKAERYKIKTTTHTDYRKLKYRELKEQVEEYLQMWEDIKI